MASLKQPEIKQNYGLNKPVKQKQEENLPQIFTKDVVRLQDILCKKLRKIEEVQKFCLNQIPVSVPLKHTFYSTYSQLENKFNEKIIQNNPQSKLIINQQLKRNLTQWDIVMEQMKFIALDFKEERKLKIAKAYNLAKKAKRQIQMVKTHNKELKLYHKVICSEMSSMIANEFSQIQKCLENNSGKTQQTHHKIDENDIVQSFLLKETDSVKYRNQESLNQMENHQNLFIDKMSFLETENFDLPQNETKLGQQLIFYDKQQQQQQQLFHNNSEDIQQQNNYDNYQTHQQNQRPQQEEHANFIYSQYNPQQETVGDQFIDQGEFKMQIEDQQEEVLDYNEIQHKKSMTPMNSANKQRKDSIISLKLNQNNETHDNAMPSFETSAFQNLNNPNPGKTEAVSYEFNDLGQMVNVKNKKFSPKLIEYIKNVIQGQGFQEENNLQQSEFRYKIDKYKTLEELRQCFLKYKQNIKLLAETNNVFSNLIHGGAQQNKSNLDEQLSLQHQNSILSQQDSSQIPKKRKKKLEREVRDQSQPNPVELLKKEIQSDILNNEIFTPSWIKKLKNYENFEETLYYQFDEQAILEGDFQNMFQVTLENSEFKQSKSWDQVPTLRFYENLNHIEDILQYAEKQYDDDSQILNNTNGIENFFYSYAELSNSMKKYEHIEHKQILFTITDQKKDLLKSKLQDNERIKDTLKEYVTKVNNYPEQNRLYLYKNTPQPQNYIELQDYENQHLQQLERYIKDWPNILYYLLEYYYNLFGNKWFTIQMSIQSNMLSYGVFINQQICEHKWLQLLAQRKAKIYNLETKLPPVNILNDLQSQALDYIPQLNADLQKIERKFQTQKLYYQKSFLHNQLFELLLNNSLSFKKTFLPLDDQQKSKNDFSEQEISEYESKINKKIKLNNKEGLNLQVYNQNGHENIKQKLYEVDYGKCLIGQNRTFNFIEKAETSHRNFLIYNYQNQQILQEIQQKAFNNVSHKSNKPNQQSIVSTRDVIKKFLNKESTKNFQLQILNQKTLMQQQDIKRQNIQSFSTIVNLQPPEMFQQDQLQQVPIKTKQAVNKRRKLFTDKIYPLIDCLNKSRATNPTYPQQPRPPSSINPIIQGSQIQNPMFPGQQHGYYQGQRINPNSQQPPINMNPPQGQSQQGGQPYNPNIQQNPYMHMGGMYQQSQNILKQPSGSFPNQQQPVSSNSQIQSQQIPAQSQLNNPQGIIPQGQNFGPNDKFKYNQQPPQIQQQYRGQPNIPPQSFQSQNHQQMQQFPNNPKNIQSNQPLTQQNPQQYMINQKQMPQQGMAQSQQGMRGSYDSQQIQNMSGQMSQQQQQQQPMGMHSRQQMQMQQSSKSIQQQPIQQNPSMQQQQLQQQQQQISQSQQMQQRIILDQTNQFKKEKGQQNSKK